MQLSRTQSLRLAAVLEVFQNQLDLLTISFKVELDKSPHSPHEKVTLNKLIQDCHILSDLMVTFRVELEDKQTFNSLLKTIENEERRKQKLAEHIRRVTKADFREKQAFCTKLEEEFENKCAIFEELQEQLALMETHKKEENEKNQIIKNDKEDKLQMLQKEANDKNRMLEEQIQLMKEQMDMERRTHKVSIEFLTSQQEEMKQHRDLWEEQTRTMRQKKSQQLNDVRCKITLTLDKLMEKRRTFRVYEQVVMEDKEEQEKLRQEQELIKAATKIEAFWRGCMVRKGLGIYKKIEDDKKGKKKDGGKEGKKKKKR